MEKTVFEAVVAGSGVLSGWELPTRMRAKLDAKVDMLRRAEFDASGRVSLPPALLAGPGVFKAPHIYKLIVEGDLALRPMFCRGPIDANSEWTALARAIERNNDTRESREAAATAAQRRIMVNDRTLPRREYDGEQQ